MILFTRSGFPDSLTGAHPHGASRDPELAGSFAEVLLEPHLHHRPVACVIHEVAGEEGPVVGLPFEAPIQKPSHIESFTGNDGSRHLPTHFGLQLGEVPELAAGSMIESAEWFYLATLPDCAAVAHHGWALDIIEEVTAAKK